MPLPEDVHRRLVARAVTDPDLASLLAIFTKPAETVSESPIDAGIVRFHLTGNNFERKQLLRKMFDNHFRRMHVNDAADSSFDAGS